MYHRIEWDFATGEVLQIEAQEHNGPVALCKGGGSSTTTVNNSSTPDYEYNKRMAAVAEQQMGMSQEFFDWWKQYQAPVEQLTLQSQAELLPLQTQISKEGLQGFQNVQNQFYQSLGPKSSTLAAGQAATDANRALGNAQASTSRHLSRLGVDPASGASQASLRSLALQGAALQTGAANAARQDTEDMNLQKLALGMQYGQQ